MKRTERKSYLQGERGKEVQRFQKKGEMLSRERYKLVLKMNGGRGTVIVPFIKKKETGPRLRERMKTVA